MWRFRELADGEPERDPHEAEFFRLTELAEAVVREVIQNSLDASRDGENPVRVCFTFGEREKENVRDYFDDLEPHLRACNLQPPDYSNSDRISFLTIEDFGTTGLDGATGEDGRRPRERSNFYNFWWYEGKSRKSGREAGRWGLGKTTFHLSSKLRSFWGLTVRQDDSRKLLMGKALFKTHRIDEAVYHYYGYFTAKNYKPIDNEQDIRIFKQKFSIRRNDEPGLSLVIPMPDDEINGTSVIRSVIIHYFFAIMKGILTVEIRELGNYWSLNSDNLINIACSQDWQGTPWEGVNVVKLMQFINDSIHATDIIELTFSEEEIPEITEDFFSNRIGELRNSFNTGNLLSFRIPVIIKKVNEPLSSTYFNVFLKKYPQLKQSDEFYIRSGITISGVRMMGNRPVRGLFAAEEIPITSFLGDSETPAHTEWNERTEGFREKYEHASRTLRFIKKSMGKIASILDTPPQERQKDFLKEIFFIPERISEEGEDRTRKPDIPPFRRRPVPFEITRIKRGFKVSLSRNDISLPIRARVTVVYDVRRSNPFKQYDIHDFDLGGSSISINSTGCTILSKNRNIMEIEITRNNFTLEVTGFDSKRDLVINTKEERNETQV